MFSHKISTEPDTNIEAELAESAEITTLDDVDDKQYSGESGISDDYVKSLPLPITLEKEIKIKKGCKLLGVSVECVKDGTNGVVILEITPGGAFDHDGRVTVGDFLLSINNESLRCCTQLQTRAIMKRTQLLSNDIAISFIPAINALRYWKFLKQCKFTPFPHSHLSSQISPRSAHIILPDLPLTNETYKRFVVKQSTLLQLKKKSISIDGASLIHRKKSCRSDDLAFDDRNHVRSFSLDLPVLNHSSNVLPFIGQNSSVNLGESSYFNVKSWNTPAKCEGSSSSIFNTSLTVSSSDNSLNASKCSSSHDMYSSHESDSVDLFKSKDDISQFEDSSKSESDTFIRHNSLPEDDFLKEGIRKLRRLSRLHHLGSLDLELLHSDSKTESICDKLRTLYRHSSTGVELGNDYQFNMTIENNLERWDILSKHWGPERRVQLYRDENSSLGISIVGGKVNVYNSNEDSMCGIVGIFIKNVIRNGPADKNGALTIGDRILEVNATDLRAATHDVAINTIKSCGNPVTFVVQSLIQWRTGNVEYRSTDQINTCESCLTNGSELKSLSGNTLPERETDTIGKLPVNDSNKNIGDHSEKQVRTKAGRLIMRNSAGSLKKSECASTDDEDEDDFGYTESKVKKKYGDLGNDVLLIELEKGLNGLGLSLAGHKDRTKMAVFVCGINPNGAAYKSGHIKVGDEILEVNGHVLHGRCHLNASAIIKGLPGPLFKMIIFRRLCEGIPDELAVRPLTHFPLTPAEKSLEEKYSNFKGVRVISMKKATPPPVEVHNAVSASMQGPRGLGIMIIEGKHAEVGHGIFISNIQQESIADQAGLMVGDMILSCNGDSLIGCNYDSAAHLLKHTEGIITLVVCNPKREVQIGAKDGEKVVAKFESEEPAVNPSVAAIRPGRECTIEIDKDKLCLGISIVGGMDTPLRGVVIHEIYGQGAAAKDGRLMPGDQLLEVNSHNFLNIGHKKAVSCLRLTPSKFTMVVYRDKIFSENNRSEEDVYKIIDVELNKKPGRGLGLSIVSRVEENGVYIAEVLPASIASIDGRIMRGDLILSIGNEDLLNVSPQEAIIALKLASGKVTLKLGRYKARIG